MVIILEDEYVILVLKAAIVLKVEYHILHPFQGPTDLVQLEQAVSNGAVRQQQGRIENLFHLGATEVLDDLLEFVHLASDCKSIVA